MYALAVRAHSYKMMPLFRISSRATNLSVKCVFASTQTSSRLTAQTLPPAKFDQTESVKAMEHVWNRNRSIVEGFQGVEPDFSLAEARRVLSIATEYQAEGPGIQGIQENYSASGLDVSETESQQTDLMSGQDVHTPVYEGFGSHVSLHGHMQSNVPHPQHCSQVLGYSSYMNMPGSGGRLLDKYASASLQICHPSRHFSTSTMILSSAQTAQEVPLDDLLVDPSPQGIQGDNCVSFKLWMENCQRYHLPNCDEQLESIKAGRKTLAQVFLEQQEIIRKVVEDYKQQQQTMRQVAANAQGLQDMGYNYELSLSDPCPQGLQGEACANFKFWAYNCQAFGFGGCTEKAEEIRTGRRTLQDVFDEQDILIRKIVNDYKQRRSYSTESSRPSGSERA